MLVIQKRFSNVIVAETDISPTLEAGAGEGGNNVPMIVQTYKQYRYSIYIPSDISAPLRAESGSLDGRGVECLIAIRQGDQKCKHTKNAKDTNSSE